MDTIKIPKKHSLMIAHGGLGGLETENTLAGVLAACNRSYWGIEVDVCYTADGEIVLIHDSSTGSVSPVNIQVEASTLTQVQSVPLYDFRNFYDMEKYGLKIEKTHTRSDLRIPTLKEYLGLCKRYCKTAVIEIKSNMNSNHIAYMLNQIDELDYREHIIFISFLWNVLCEVRRQAPDIAIQFLIGSNADFTDEYLDKIADKGFDLDIYVFSVTKDLVDRVHERNMKLGVWTCDWPDKAAELMEWGVDYISSNILE